VTDPRVLRNRAGLRQALLELLQSKPFDLITIRDIVAAAGVGYTTYFRYYANKEALLGDVAIREVRQLHEMTLPVYRAKDSRAACLALCAYVDDHRRVWSALLSGADGYVRMEMLRLGREDTNLPAMRTRGWLPQDLGVVLSVAVMVELLGWWLHQTDPMPVARVADIMDRVAVSPLSGEMKQ
jgi:AcrR family transcriptional regulator